MCEIPYCVEAECIGVWRCRSFCKAELWLLSADPKVELCQIPVLGVSPQVTVTRVAYQVSPELFACGCSPGDVCLESMGAQPIGGWFGHHLPGVAVEACVRTRKRESRIRSNGIGIGWVNKLIVVMLILIGVIWSLGQKSELYIPGLQTTIQTMGAHITTVVHLRIVIIHIGSTIILMRFNPRHMFLSELLSGV